MNQWLKAVLCGAALLLIMGAEGLTQRKKEPAWTRQHASVGDWIIDEYGLTEYQLTDTRPLTEEPRDSRIVLLYVKSGCTPPPLDLTRLDGEASDHMRWFIYDPVVDRVYDSWTHAWK